MTEASQKGRPPRAVVLLFGGFAEYVWGLRFLFLLCLFVFFASVGMGFYLGDSIPLELPEEVSWLLEYIGSLSLPMIFLAILLNNLLSSLIWMAMGALFSVPPLYFIVRNGFVVGRVSYTTSLTIGLPLTAFLLIPHGVIEIPAVLLSMAAGMGLGYQLINSLRRRGSLRAEFGKALRLFVWRIAPMLLIAAAIEVALMAATLYLQGVGWPPTAT